MQLTELRIAPQHAYQALGPKNQMRATVKLNADTTAIECALSDATMQRILGLIQSDIIDTTTAHLDAFRAVVGQHDIDA